MLGPSPFSFARSSSAAAVTATGAEPGAGLALSFGDFACAHLECNLGAALLPTRAARQGREVEPFVRFDEVDVDPPAPCRIGHAKLEQRIDIAIFGIGKAAAKQEFRTLLADGTHETFPLPVGCKFGADLQKNG